VLTSPIVNHIPNKTSLRPIVQAIKVAYPQDVLVETYQFVAIDVVSGNIEIADWPSLPSGLSDNTGLFFSRLLWWANDSRLAYFIAQERGDRLVSLVEFDTHTGNTQVLFEESSDTHINIVTSDYTSAPSHRVLPDTHELIWWSERSGWGHLYLYDFQSGELKHPITQGDWLVRDVLFVDQKKREIFIQTAGRVPGRNPYYRDICRVNIDTGEIVTLFSSDEDVIVRYPEGYYVPFKTQGVSQNGDYLVITRSRVDQAPVTELLNRDGEQLLEIEVADISSLPTDWTWPESVKVLAADNVTPLYGVLFRPSHFDADKSYPLINYVGSGPWLSMTPAGSFHSTGSGYRDWHYFNAAALAELGFIVLQLDSRGTPLRSKAFQDHSYGWAPDAINSEDHATALQQLATQYPAIDPERMGSYCVAYAGGLINFLERQNLYRVHVQASVLDVRLVSCSMKGDVWEGLDGPPKDKCHPEQLVTNLRRKLLLMHPLFGHQADVYPLTAAMRVVHALQKANKDFDLLMTPETGPSFGHYSTRRIWDYFVKHLMGAEAPKEFALKSSILP
jgi:dipeptidyl aminopeptidase/acylaminoacyl peptidase